MLEADADFKADVKEYYFGQRAIDDPRVKHPHVFAVGQSYDIEAFKGVKIKILAYCDSIERTINPRRFPEGSSLFSPAAQMMFYDVQEQLKAIRKLLES